MNVRTFAIAKPITTTMKKVFSLMLLFALFAIAMPSCSDDDDEPTVDPLIGTWIHTEQASNANLGVTVIIESKWIFLPDKTCTWTVSSRINNTTTNSESTRCRYSYSSSTKTLTLTHDNGKKEEITCVVKGETMTIITSKGSSMAHYKQ